MYDTLAEVYDFLVPEPLLTPEGSATAFGQVVDHLEPGARVLDCACGTGQLAVGLALRGFDVTATDGSAPMVERTRLLAAERDVEITARTVLWEQLAGEDWDEEFDAVFCVGNSIAHALGQAGRRTALKAMASTLADDGVLAVTSRNWHQIRIRGSGLQVADRLTERHGEHALVVYGWTIADRWEEPHRLVVAVATVGRDASVTTRSERLTFWPFTYETLVADLEQAGLEVTDSTYTPEGERYLVVACAARG